MGIQNILQKQEDLHKDLQPYIEEGSFFPMLRHPLIFSVPYTPVMNALINMQYKQKKQLESKYLKAKNYSSYVWLHERPYRIQAFLNVREKLKDKDYWETLGDIWRDSENIWQNKMLWLALLSVDRKQKEYFMNEEDRRFLKLLPKEIIIYRGYIKNKNKSGYSYTLNKEKAKWFANRFGNNGLVETRTINKSDVFAYTNQRGENEIIILK